MGRLIFKFSHSVSLESVFHHWVYSLKTKFPCFPDSLWFLLALELDNWSLLFLFEIKMCLIDKSVVS